MSAPTARRILAVGLALGAIALAGCGDDDGDDDGGGPRSADEWRQSVDGFCSDALQEATALPLPETLEQLGPDASQRAEILGNVRDSILTLGQPEGLTPEEVGGYVDELNADIDQLGQISEAVADGDPNPPQLDESAGEAASELGLEACPGLAQAIARTPLSADRQAPRRDLTGRRAGGPVIFSGPSRSSIGT